MKRILIVTLLAAALLSACVYVPREGVVVPFLPPVVVLEAEPYYFYEGYHYHYNNDRWYYSKSRKGPWYDLPHDHYPKELRYKDKHRKKYRDHDDRYYDDRYRR